MLLLRTPFRAKISETGVWYQFQIPFKCWQQRSVSLGLCCGFSWEVHLLIVTGCNSVFIALSSHCWFREVWNHGEVKIYNFQYHIVSGYLSLWSTGGSGLRFLFENGLHDFRRCIADILIMPMIMLSCTMIIIAMLGNGAGAAAPDINKAGNLGALLPGTLGAHRHFFRKERQK